MFDFLICKTATLISLRDIRSDTLTTYQQIENLTFNTDKTACEFDPPIVYNWPLFSLYGIF